MVFALNPVKDDVGEVLESFECGIGIENMHDFNENDIIEECEKNNYFNLSFATNFSKGSFTLIYKF